MAEKTLLDGFGEATEEVISLRAELKATRGHLQEFIDAWTKAEAELAATREVIEAARRAHRTTGHNLDGWVECADPEHCWWLAMDAALARLDAAPGPRPEPREEHGQPA